MTCALALSRRFITGCLLNWSSLRPLRVVTLRPLRFKILDNLGKGQTHYRKVRKAKTAKDANKTTVQPSISHQNDAVISGHS